MIVVVILIAAITTIIAASVDLSRMAVYKQNQAEREAKWQYCVDSGRALVVENLVALAGTTQSFSKTVNGIDLTISASSDPFWNPETSTKLAITGILDRSLKTTNVFVGKRSTVNPCEFGLFIADLLNTTTSTLQISGDVYLDGSITASRLLVIGDLYCPSPSSPTIFSLSGSYFGRQSGQSIVLDNAIYSANAYSRSSGTLTLTDPTAVLLRSHSELRYHTGILTITGKTNGHLTVFVNGSVILDKIRDTPGDLSRLVVICNGDVTFKPGINDAFVISSGRILFSAESGPRTLNGSLAASQFPNTSNLLQIYFDDYFVTTPSSGFHFYIPGQW